jgi:hypothetical protein
MVQEVELVDIFFCVLKFCYLHVCGLKSGLLCPDFINIIQQHNICVLTETKLTENI